VRIHAFVLCEKVLIEKDNTVSAVRIVDRLMFGQAPTAEARVAQILSLLTMAKPEQPDAPPSNPELEIRVVGPAGKITPLSKSTLQITNFAGANAVVTGVFAFETTGVYRFEAALDGVLAATILVEVTAGLGTGASGAEPAGTDVGP
jgi:hypothetical protein